MTTPSSTDLEKAIATLTAASIWYQEENWQTMDYLHIRDAAILLRRMKVTLEKEVS